MKKILSLLSVVSLTTPIINTVSCNKEETQEIQETPASYLNDGETFAVIFNSESAVPEVKIEVDYIYWEMDNMVITQYYRPKNNDHWFKGSQDGQNLLNIEVEKNKPSEPVFLKIDHVAVPAIQNGDEFKIEVSSDNYPTQTYYLKYLLVANGK